MRLFITTLCLVSLTNWSEEPKEKTILGKWKIISWYSSVSERDALKDKHPPILDINFTEGKVTIRDTEKEDEEEYSFRWSIENNELIVKSLTTFKIVELTKDRLKLGGEVSNIFDTETPSVKHELTLER